MRGSGNVAVLFTDLVGSTALASRLGPERAEELRKEHFGLLRAAVARSGGTEVKNLGDGLMVVFESGSAALSCAVAMQQAFDARNRVDERSGRLDIRVGVALGEADEDDGDYFGPPVVEAARLCALADGGQVLATEVVRLIVGSRGGHAFTSLGERELKGLPEPVGVVEVGWEPLTDVERTGFSVPLPARLTPVTGSVFAGRRRELEQANGAWKSVAEGDRRVWMVSGEAGIGKTTLVSRICSRAHDEGAVVVFGRCDEDLRQPYQPWVEALTTLVERLPDEALAEHVESRGGELARIVPALTARTGVEPSTAENPEGERYALVGAVADLLQRAADLVPVLLVLDDLHWSDGPTVSVLRHLATHQEPLRLMVIGTYRQTDLAAGDPLSDAMAPLHREACVEFVPLSGLDDTELLELMEAIAGHEMNEDGLVVRDMIAAETGGNAFFANEVLLHLAVTGAIEFRDGRWEPTVDLASHGLPVSVREVVAQRVARLGPDAERLLRFAAVVGRDFDLPVVAEVARVDEDDALDLLEAATAAAVITETGPDRYTFVHALVVDTLYEDLSPARRARAHRRVAEVLEERLGDRPGERVVDLAMHWAAATVPDDTDRAVEYSVLAGDRALTQLAPDEALRWYAQARDLLGPSSDPTLGVRAEVGLGIAQSQLGDPAHRETLLDAGRTARDLGATDQLVAAVLANHRGIVATIGFDAERFELLEAALDAVGEDDSVERARLLAVVATELGFHPARERRESLADEAVAMARRVGDRSALLAVLQGWLAQADLYTAADRERLAAMGDEMLDIAQQLGEHTGLAHAAASIATICVNYGDRERYDRAVRLCSEAAALVGHPLLRFRSAAVRATAAVVDGRLEDAEALAEELLLLGTESGQPDALVWYAALLTTIRFHQGRAIELREFQRTFVEDAASDDFVGQVAGMGLLLGAIQDRDRQAIEESRAGLDPLRSDLSYFQVLALGEMAHASAVADDSSSAEELLRALEPFRDMFDCAVITNFYATSTCSGMLAALLGRDDDADGYFAEAVDLSSGFDAPYHLAFARTEWARVLLRRATVDRDHVRSLLTDALDAARRHGYAAVERDAGELLAQVA